MVPVSTTRRRKSLVGGARVCEHVRPMQKLIQICREEFRKAGKAIAAAYKTMREIDARTTEILLALLGRSK